MRSSYPADEPNSGCTVCPRCLQFFCSCPMICVASCTSRSPNTPLKNGRHRKFATPFSWDEAPQYLLRDRDAIYSREFGDLIGALGMEEVMTAPRSPWPNPYVERLVGSVRRECLDHVIVWNHRSPHRIPSSYFAYYHSRTHLALGKDTPEPRAVEPPQCGPVFATPQVGGLHHRYQRCAE